MGSCFRVTFSGLFSRCAVWDPLMASRSSYEGIARNREDDQSSRLKIQTPSGVSFLLTRSCSPTIWLLFVKVGPSALPTYVTFSFKLFFIFKYIILCSLHASPCGSISGSTPRSYKAPFIQGFSSNKGRVGLYLSLALLAIISIPLTYWRKLYSLEFLY